MAADRGGFKPEQAVIIFAETKNDGINKAYLLNGTYEHVGSEAVLGYQQSLLTSRQIPWAFLGDVLEDMSAYGVRVGN